MSKSPNHFNGRSGWYTDTICCHITEGSYAGSVSWLCNPASQVSAHVVIGREGQKDYLVDFKDGAWANGCTVAGSQASTLDYVRNRRTNANLYTLSIEFEGWHATTDGELTEAQYQTGLAVMKEMISWMESTYKLTFDIDNHIIGHNMISPAGKPFCPGSKFPYSRFKQDLHAWKGGGSVTPTPEPTPQPSADINVGDNIIIKSSASTFTNGVGIAGFAKNRTSQASAISGNAVLVSYNGIAIGWVYKWDLDKVGGSSSGNTSSSGSIREGDTVIIKSSATHFTNGASIAGFAKNRPSQVHSISGDRALITYGGVIVGWVNISDLEKQGGNSSTSAPSRNITVGSRVLLKASASRYETGQTIPASIKNKVYTVMQVGSGNTHPNGVLLKEIMSWVNKGDVQLA